jgi:hypothetical protein
MGSERFFPIYNVTEHLKEVVNQLKRTTINDDVVTEDPEITGCCPVAPTIDFVFDHWYVQVAINCLNDAQEEKGHQRESKPVAHGRQHV